MPLADPTAAPLAPLTTLRLGGPARRLVAVEREQELVEAVRSLDADGEPLLLLAGGSNVVIADAGFDGTVVHVRTRGIERDGDTLAAAAGEPWDGVVAHAVEAGLAGVEALSGIPGSAGATPIQNVGAYGQDVSQTVASVRVLDRRTGAVEELPPQACGFRYRESVFKGRADHVVLAVRYRLRSGATGLGEPVAYPELARALDVELGARAPLGDVRAAVLALRRRKGMVVDPADPDSVSAGSFFTNPVLTRAELAALQRRAAEAGAGPPGGATSPRSASGVAARSGPTADAPAPLRPPAFPEPDGRVKTSAAWLIEHAGFARGHARGQAAISAKHTLALVNRGGATTAELVALAREIAAGVERSFGVQLVPEPVFVGHAW